MTPNKKCCECLLAEETTNRFGITVDGVEGPGETKCKNGTDEEKCNYEGLVPGQIQTRMHEKRNTQDKETQTT